MPLLNGRNLDGRDVTRFSEALRDAFRNPPQLDMMLNQGMNLNLWDKAPWGSEFDVAANNLILNLQADGRTAELLIAARLARPGNVKLLRFAQGFGLTSLPTAPDFLERIVRPRLPFLDIQVFLRHLGEVEGRVGRVEVETKSGTEYGTGFLVGPDRVLTNYHVVESAIQAAKAGDPEAGHRVAIRFDYKVMSDGVQVFPGTLYKLADAWLDDSSPYSAVDNLPDPKPGEPGPEELDYALLKLSVPAAEDPVGGPMFAGAGVKRGFVPLAADAKPGDLAKGAPLFIVQHPSGNPLKLSVDTQGLVGTNGNGTRVRYENNTEDGSSGSPCFDTDFRLLALHHSGDPRTKGSAEYNEGIPSAPIRSLLKSRGKDGGLG